MFDIVVCYFLKRNRNEMNDEGEEKVNFWLDFNK